MLKYLQNKLLLFLANSHFGRWLTGRSYKTADYLCRRWGHKYLVRVDKPLGGHYFQHILYCGRCWRNFGNRNVRVYDYDSPGYESSMRIWLASLNTVKLDSNVIRRLGENLIKLRFRVQNEPSMYEKLRKEQKNDGTTPSFIARPSADEIGRIIRGRD